uniref:VWFA domain-containing protein n=1 Tax=Panagrellus redivivus TaxID=6233 RepID=A0A7E4UWB9_PANRE
MQKVSGHFAVETIPSYFTQLFFIAGHLMASDTFLYVSILILPCLSIPQQFFQNGGFQQQGVWNRGYQPPPTAALRPEYARQTAPPAFNPFQSQFVPYRPQAPPQNPYPATYPPAINPGQGISLPKQQQPYVAPVTPVPMRFVPNPKPPIVINTLIQVYVDGKNNRTVGDRALEGRIVTGVHNNDRVILAREFDTKTLTFVEDDKDSSHSREDIVNIKAVATSNATELEHDELAEELEKELANSIPLILEELDRVKPDKKQMPFKDTMMTDNLNNVEKTRPSPPHVDDEDDVNIEDLEQLIRDGLDELEDGEAKKKLEEEFHAVLLSSTKPTPSGRGSTTTAPNTPKSTKTSTTITTPKTTSISATSTTIESTPTEKSSTSVIPTTVETTHADTSSATESVPTTEEATSLTTEGTTSLATEKTTSGATQESTSATEKASSASTEEATLATNEATSVSTSTSSSTHTQPTTSGSSSTSENPNSPEDMEKRAMGSSERAPEEASSTTSLPPGIVTTIENLEPVTAHSSDEISSTGATSATSSETTQVITTGSVESMAAINEATTTVTDDTNEETTLETQRPTPVPVEMMMPEQAFLASAEDVASMVNAKVTAEPAEMVVPIKAMVVKSEESEEEEETDVTRPTAAPAEMIMPEHAMIIESAEVTTTSVKPTPEPAEMVVPIKAMILKSAESEEEEFDETRPTAPPAEMIVPQKAMEMKSIEAGETSPPPTTSTTTTTTTTTTTPKPTTTTTTTKKPTTTSTTTTTTTTKPTTSTSTTTTTTKPTTTSTSTTTTTTKPTTTTTTSTSTSTSTTTTTTTPPTTTTLLPTTATPFTTDVCEIPNDETDTLRGDVMFLLDSSTSVGPKDFKKAVQLIKQVVLNFKNIGPNGVQFGLVQYNREPWLEFTFRRHNCISQLLSDIDDTDFMNGPSNLGRAMDKVMKYGFTPARGDRPDAENVLVLVTDGLSDDEVSHPVTLGRRNGTTPIAVATLHGKKEILMSLAEDDPKNLFNLTDAFTNSLGDRLANRIKSILEAAQNNNTNTQVLTTTSGPLIHEVSASDIDHELPADSFSSIAPMMLPIEDDSSASVKCTHNGIIATIQIPENFGGAIVAKDFAGDPGCTVDIPILDKDSDDTRPVEVELKVGQCGVRILKMDDSAMRHSVVLNVLHNRDLITAQDKSYVIQCFHPNNASTTELETKLTTDEVPPFSKTISLSVTPPKCRYSLRRDTVNGPVVTNAKIGQVVFHRWECDGDEITNKAYGLYIHDCKATNTSARHNNFAIIDDNGCSTDPSVVNEIIYAENQLLAFSKSYVFTLVDVATLLFSCKVSLCVRDGDGCEGYSPPVCATSNMTDLLLTRRVRHYDEGLQAALTSQVRTDVIDVSNPLVSTRFYHVHLPVIAVVTLALTLGSLLGILWYCMDSQSEKKAAAVHSTSSQFTFPDDESTTDKSETLSFRSLDFRTSDETSLDMSEAVPSAAPSLSGRQA